MNKGDVRAVENPITAIFDLAEDVEAQSPKIRIAIQYARIFIGFWLILNALLIVVVAAANFLALALSLIVFLLLLVRRWMPNAASRTFLLGLALVMGALLLFTFVGAPERLLLGLVLVPFFFLGLVAMGYLREIKEFFDYYALRHRVVKSVRDADPVAYVPDGTDVTQRVIRFLASRNPDIDVLMRTPHALSMSALLQGKSGMTYQFDAYLSSPSSTLWPLLGIGKPGYAVFVKAFKAPPTVNDFAAVKRAVEDVAATTRVPPARVITVWHAEGEAGLPEDAYEYVMKEVIRLRHFGKEFVCSLQSIAESPDGTYDFIPFVPEIGGPAQGSV